MGKLDDHHFMVFPIVLGSGFRLFNNGVVVHTYVRMRS